MIHKIVTADTLSKISNMNFHENPFCGKRSLPSGQMDMTGLVVVFRKSFSKTRTNCCTNCSADYLHRHVKIKTIHRSDYFWLLWHLYWKCKTVAWNNYIYRRWQQRFWNIDLATYSLLCITEMIASYLHRQWYACAVLHAAPTICTPRLRKKEKEIKHFLRLYKLQNVLHR
jgi:hypothetical protein